MSSLSIEGLENLQKIMREFPEEGFRKPMLTAFTRAATPVKRAMINQLPGSLKSLKRVIKVKAYRGKSPVVKVGVFARQGVYRNSKGKEWDPYVLALWHNYGTLDYRANRFHTFKKPARKTKSGSMAGIKPGLYIERGWEQSKGQAQRTLEESAEKEIMKFLEKNANK